MRQDGSSQALKALPVQLPARPQPLDVGVEEEHERVLEGSVGDVVAAAEPADVAANVAVRQAVVVVDRFPQRLVLRRP
jgi:predicted protein tyrosine phosphatase